MNDNSSGVPITGLAEYGYIWVLNPMTSNSESQAEFGPFSTKQEALEYLENEKVDPYEDEGLCHFSGGKKVYRKCFRKGGPLEWYNPENPDGHSPWGHGLHKVLLRVYDIQEM